MPLAASAMPSAINVTTSVSNVAMRMGKARRRRSRLARLLSSIHCRALDTQSGAGGIGVLEATGSFSRLTADAAGEPGSSEEVGGTGAVGGGARVGQALLKKLEYLLVAFRCAVCRYQADHLVFVGVVFIGRFGWGRELVHGGLALFEILLESIANSAPWMIDETRLISEQYRYPLFVRW